MLETEMKKLTAAIEALTAAMTPLTIDAAPVTEEPVMVKFELPPSLIVEAMDKDVLTRMCLELSRDGHKDAIKAKLATYGATHVTKLVGDKNYGPFCDWIVEQSGGAQ